MLVQDKIIFSNSLNQNEYIRSLARNDDSVFNVRVFNLIALCDEINARLGQIQKNNYKNDEEAAFYLLDVFKNDARFKSYDDIQHVVRSIKEMRSLVLNDKELIAKLKPYQTELGIQVITNVLLNYHYRDAMSYASETLANIKEPLFKEITIFSNEYISPLALALINKASQIVVKKELAHEYKIKDITPCYGEENEIDATLSQIKNDIKKHKLDENLIVLMDENRYLYHLYRYAVIYKLPISFGNGIPVKVTNPYKFYRLIDDLEFVYQFDINGYRALFKAESFKFDDKNNEYLPEILGYLKIDFDKLNNEEKIKKLFNNPHIEFLLKEILNIKKVSVNEIKEKTINFVNEISLGRQNFIANHTYITADDQIGKTALSLIVETITKAKHIQNNDMRKSYLKSIDKLNVGATNSKPGYIHVVPFNKARAIYRNVTYVLGLSSDIFPSNKKENYLLPDDVLKSINENALTSKRKTQQQLTDFDILVGELYKKRSDIYLSYSFFNLVDVKGANPTSKIYDILANQSEFANLNLEYLEKKKNNTSYFIGSFNAINKLGQKFLQNNDAIVYKSLASEKTYNTSLYQPGVSLFSPSNIENYHQCPKKFFVLHLLDVDTISDYDAYRAIAGNHFGTLIHHLLEKYHYLTSVSEFKEKANEIFDAYLALNITNTPTNIERYDFINAAIIGYKYLKQFASIKVEDWIKFDDGVVALRGRYDALAKTSVDSYLLIDYKSGHIVDRKSDDVNTLLQIMLYIRILKGKGYDVNSGVYFYVRSGHQVHVTYDENFVKQTLIKLRMALDKRDFVATPDKKKCKYCPILDFCKEAIK